MPSDCCRSCGLIHPMSLLTFSLHAAQSELGQLCLIQEKPVKPQRQPVKPSKAAQSILSSDYTWKPYSEGASVLILPCSLHYSAVALPKY